MAKALVILKLARGTVFRGMAPSIEDLMFSSSVGCGVCRVRGGRRFMQTVQKLLLGARVCFLCPYAADLATRGMPLDATSGWIRGIAVGKWFAVWVFAGVVRAELLGFKSL